MTAKIQKFSLEKLSKQLKKAWTPVNVANVDGFVLRMAKFRGKYHWHRHKGDELFIVFKGKINVQTKLGDIEISQGEGVKIPKSIDHCPIAILPSVVLMFENEIISQTKKPKKSMFGRFKNLPSFKREEIDRF